MVRYIYNGHTEQMMTFSTMVDYAIHNGGGPQAVSSEKIDVLLLQEQGAAVVYGEPLKRYATVGLITCAAVIFASAESTSAYIYHASRGVVPKETFNNAIAALGPVPLPSVRVIYTFPGDSNEYYEENAGKLVLYGVPSKNIVFAPNLALNTFGINSATFIG